MGSEMCIRDRDLYNLLIVRLLALALVLVVQSLLHDSCALLAEHVLEEAPRPRAPLHGLLLRGHLAGPAPLLADRRLVGLDHGVLFFIVVVAVCGRLN